MKKIAILGGGVSGRGAALLAEKNGSLAVILNDGENKGLPADAGLIVASPGVPMMLTPIRLRHFLPLTVLPHTKRSGAVCLLIQSL